MSRASFKTLAGSAVVLAMLMASASASAQGESAYDDWNPDLIGFPSNTPDSPRANCAGGSTQCIDRTIGEMWRRFHAVVPSCEHNAVFSLTYLRVTEDIRNGIDEGFYPDLHWIDKLDAMFARVYFLTYRNWLAGRRALVPGAWRTAFDTAHEESVEGIGNLLLSMNAHINRDFPFMLYHAGLVNSDGSSKKDEHDSGNERLRALYKPMLTELANRFDESIDDYDVPGTSADDEAIFQILVGWRETAWQNAVRLADASSDAERREIAASIEDYADSQAQFILGGSAYGPGEDSTARNAQCAERGGQRPAYRRGSDVAKPIGLVRLHAHKAFVTLRCPFGPGPCRGRLALGLKGPDAKRSFTVRKNHRVRFAIKLDREMARSLRARDGRRVRIRARSKLGPGDSVVERSRARLRVGAFR